MNLNNETWMIENGVLKHYRGAAKSVKIPEGVKVIDSFAFSKGIRNINIENVTFSSTVKEINRWCFFHQSLSSISIPANILSIDDHAFDGNPISKVIFEKRDKMLKWEEPSVLSYIKQLEVYDNFYDYLSFQTSENGDFSPFYVLGHVEDLTLHLTDFTFSYERFITMIKNYFPSLKKLIIKKGTKHSIKDVKGIFQLKLLTGIKVEVQKEEISKAKLEENLESVSMTSEINEVITQIQNIALSMDTKQREKIYTTVNQLVFDYKTKIRDMEPKIENSSQIELSVSENTLSGAKFYLLNSLNNLLFRLQINDRYVGLREEIAAYEQMLKQKEVLEPKQVLKTKDEVAAIVYMTNVLENESYRRQLQKILDAVKEKISVDVDSFSSFEMTMEDYALTFSKNIASLYQEVLKFYEERKPYLDLYQSFAFFQKNASSISEDLRSAFDIVNELFKKAPNNFQRELNHLILKYQNLLRNAYVSVSSLEKSAIVYEQEFRLEFQTLLQTILAFSEKLQRNDSFAEQIEYLYSLQEQFQGKSLMDISVPTKSDYLVPKGLLVTEYQEILDLCAFLSNDSEEIFFLKSLNLCVSKWHTILNNKDTVSSVLQKERENRNRQDAMFQFPSYEISDDLLLEMIIFRDFSQIKQTILAYKKNKNAYDLETQELEDIMELK